MKLLHRILTHLLIVVLVTDLCIGHLRLTYPQPRQYALDFLDTFRTPGPCGMDKNDDTITEFAEGSTINVTWHLGYPHNGGYNFEILEGSRVVHRLTEQNVWKGADNPTKLTDTIKFPDGYTCDGCTLRMWRQALEWGSGYRFWSCADLNIRNPYPQNDTPKCNDNQELVNGECRCKRTYYGPDCSFKDECVDDSDCGRGKCMDIEATSAPIRQCYCEPGWFGRACEKVSPLSSATFDPSDYPAHRTLSDTFEVYYKVMEASEEIEVALRVNSTTWVALGWRSRDAERTCQGFPTDKHVTPDPEGEGEPTGEPEHEPTGEPEHEPTGEPEHEPTGEPEHEPTGEPEHEPTDGYVSCNEWSTGCDNNGVCDYKITWAYTETEDSVAFEIKARQASDRWTGVGFASNPEMSNVDVILGNGDFLIDGWIGNRYNSPTEDGVQNIADVTRSHENGITTLAFTRPRVSTDSMDHSFSDTDCYYMFYPVGGGSLGNGNSINRHTSTPVISSQTICFKPCIDPEGEGEPTGEPEHEPTGEPEHEPTGEPEHEPTGEPEHEPTGEPEHEPTGEPEHEPTSEPEHEPTGEPEHEPTGEPEHEPTGEPEHEPTGEPEHEPTGEPEHEPTSEPENEPTGEPEHEPTGEPEHEPTGEPENEPTGEPEHEPTGEPEHEPTGEPEHEPTGEPEHEPTGEPENEPTVEPEGEGGDDNTQRPTHAMDCTDIVLGSARGTYSRIGDYYTRDRSTPQFDDFYGGTDSLTAAVGWEDNGLTTIVFRRKLEATEQTDWTIENEIMDVIWARGQEPDNYNHWPNSGVEGSANADKQFYKPDETKYHGHGGTRGKLSQRGTAAMNFFDGFVSCNEWSTGCDNNGVCDYKITWAYTETDDSVAFEIKARQASDRWTGVGFASNPEMSNVDVILGNGDFLIDGWIGNRYDAPTEDGVQNIADVTRSHENGITTLAFTRPRVSTDSMDHSFSDTDCYYMFYPVGGGSLGNGNSINRHTSTPAISSQTICFKPCIEPKTTSARPLEVTSTSATVISTEETKTMSTWPLEITSPTTLLREEPTTEAPTEAKLVQVEVAVRLMTEWDEAYNNFENEITQELISAVEKEMDETLRPMVSGYKGYTVTDLRQGSVIVNGVAEAETEQSSEDVVHRVIDGVHEMASDGQIGNFEVDRGYLNVGPVEDDTPTPTEPTPLPKTETSQLLTDIEIAVIVVCCALVLIAAIVTAIRCREGKSKSQQMTYQVYDARITKSGSVYA